MRLSYAQRLEDIHLDCVFADEPAGFYIDVGGGHPIADNVTLLFYEKNWRGLVIEPQSHLAAIHRSLRPRDLVFEGLVGKAEGEALFHQVDRFHGFSTTIDNHAQAASATGVDVRSLAKPMTTLAKLCATHGITAVDFLKIDVEGAEADVLAGFDFSALRPRIVVVEAVAPGTMTPSHDSFEPLLLSRNYRLAFEDGLNRFYVRGEEAELARRFPQAPLAWDSVAHLYDEGRADENPLHRDHRLAKSLVRGLLAGLPSHALGEIRQWAATGVGNAENPAQTLSDEELRLALGRICAAYDGGHLMED